jgi:hypothetical protein
MMQPSNQTGTGGSLFINQNLTGPLCKLTLERSAPAIETGLLAGALDLALAASGTPTDGAYVVSTGEAKQD